MIISFNTIVYLTGNIYTAYSLYKYYNIEHFYNAYKAVSYIKSKIY